MKKLKPGRARRVRRIWDFKTQGYPPGITPEYVAAEEKALREKAETLAKLNPGNKPNSKIQKRFRKTRKNTSKKP